MRVQPGCVATRVRDLHEPLRAERFVVRIRRQRRRVDDIVRPHGELDGRPQRVHTIWREVREQFRQMGERVVKRCGSPYARSTSGHTAGVPKQASQAARSVRAISGSRAFMAAIGSGGRCAQHSKRGREQACRLRTRTDCTVSEVAMKRIWPRCPLLAIWAVALALYADLASAAPDVSISRADDGTTAAGQRVSQYTLANQRGVTLKVITYGAIVTALDVPDRTGHVADIVLGFDSLHDYEAHNGNIHFGALIGRYANRIAGGRFRSMAGRGRCRSTTGRTRCMAAPAVSTRRYGRSPVRTATRAVRASRCATWPDGENGFPGTLTTDVTYMLTRDNQIRIDYRATTDKDTVVNLTNHSYFNLAGQAGGSVERQLIEIAASRFTPTDETSIPTGQLASVAGTPMDLRQLTPIGAHLRDAYPQLVTAHGYDQNWVLEGGQPAPAFAARAYDPASGRFLELYTTQPGLQFYTANGLNGSVAGKGGRSIGKPMRSRWRPSIFPIRRIIRHSDDGAQARRDAARSDGVAGGAR